MSFVSTSTGTIGGLGQVEDIAPMLIIGGILLLVFFAIPKGGGGSGSRRHGRGRVSRPVSYYQERSRKRRKHKLSELSGRAEHLSSKIKSWKPAYRGGAAQF